MLTMGDVLGTLNLIDLDAVTVREIVSILEAGATDIDGNPVEPVPDPAFGPSPGGGELARHTAIAHRHVAEAMANMVTGLQGYRANIESYAESQARADDDSHTRLSSIVPRIDAATECVTSEVATPSCTLPGA